MVPKTTSRDVHGNWRRQSRGAPNSSTLGTVAQYGPATWPVATSTAPRTVTAQARVTSTQPGRRGVGRGMAAPYDGRHRRGVLLEEDIAPAAGVRSSGRDTRGGRVRPAP